MRFATSQSGEASPRLATMIRRSRVVTQLEVGAMWMLGHLSRLWPFLVFATVLTLSWGPLTQISARDFRAALRSLDPAWLGVAAAITITNIGVMGLYDIIAFRHTRAPWYERWRYGAVAFAWSNFLTLGPLAGPAIRLWLYRPAVDHASELNGGVVSVAIAFTGGLIGWTLAIAIAAREGISFIALSLGAFAFVLACVWIARVVAGRTRWVAAPMPGQRSSVFQLAVVGWLDWLLAAAAF